MFPTAAQHSAPTVFAEQYQCPAVRCLWRCAACSHGSGLAWSHTSLLYYWFLDNLSAGKQRNVTLQIWRMIYYWQHKIRWTSHLQKSSDPRSEWWKGWWSSVESPPPHQWSGSLSCPWRPNQLYASNHHLAGILEMEERLVMHWFYYERHAQYTAFILQWLSTKPCPKTGSSNHWLSNLSRHGRSIKQMRKRCMLPKQSWSFSSYFFRLLSEIEVGKYFSLHTCLLRMESLIDKAYDSFNVPKPFLLNLTGLQVATCSKLEFLLSWLEYGDVDLSLTQTQLKGTQVISEAREHEQPCVVPGAELELDEHAWPPEEARHLQEVVGPGKGHRFEENVAAGKVHLFLRARKKNHWFWWKHFRWFWFCWDHEAGQVMVCKVLPFVVFGCPLLLSWPCQWCWCY